MFVDHKNKESLIKIYEDTKPHKYIVYYTLFYQVIIFFNIMSTSNVQKESIFFHSYMFGKIEK